MTVEELADKYMKEAVIYNYGVDYIKPEDKKSRGLIKVWFKRREEYYVLISKIGETWFLRVFRLKDGEEIFIDNDDYGTFNDPPYPSLNYARVFLVRAIERDELKEKKKMTNNTTKTNPITDSEIRAHLLDHGWKRGSCYYFKGDNMIFVSTDRIDFDFYGGNAVGTCDFDNLCIDDDGDLKLMSADLYLEV